MTTSATGAEHVGEATGDSRHDEKSEREATGSDVRHPEQISATVGVDNGGGGVIVLPRCRSKLSKWMQSKTQYMYSSSVEGNQILRFKTLNYTACYYCTE